MTHFPLRTKRRVRIYELYAGIAGYSNRVADYGWGQKGIVHVAARSIREAYYLANHGRWRDAIGIVGIVEQFDGSVWKHEDGTLSASPRYRHGGSARRVN